MQRMTLLGIMKTKRIHMRLYYQSYPIVLRAYVCLRYVREVFTLLTKRCSYSTAVISRRKIIPLQWGVCVNSSDFRWGEGHKC